MKAIELNTAWEKDYVTIRYRPDKKFIWNEWRGVIPSEQLREAIIYECGFILDNKIECMLSDYTMMSPPSTEDQVWIANHTAELLQHSSLRFVANLMAQDFFQQMSLQTIYGSTNGMPLPCESRDFFTKEEALAWLFPEGSNTNKQAGNGLASYILP